MRRSMILGMGVAVIAFAAPMATAQAANPGGNGLIAFIGLNYHVSVIRPDGTGYRRVTNGSDFNPAWSPDGTKIAFERELGPQGVGRIFVVNEDGSNPHQLFAGGGRHGTDAGPSYSPNGKQVAFIRNPHTVSGNCFSHIMIGTVATGVVRQTAAPACAFDVHWSPTGNTLLFTHPHNFRSALYTYNLTTNRTRMVTDSVQSFSDWSPDGTRIVFDRETFAGGGPNTTSTNLFTIRRNGTALRQITHFPPAGNDPGSGANAPAYSPAGDAVVFLFQKPRAFDQLAILSPANGNGSVTYLPAHANDQPSWQPTH